VLRPSALCFLQEQRRRLVASARSEDATPATTIAVLRNSTRGPLQWASALLSQVLADAEARRLQREATGTTVLGVSTGLAQLDSLLGGLNEGLHLLVGPPGRGKRPWRCR